MEATVLPSNDEEATRLLSSKNHQFKYKQRYWDTTSASMNLCTTYKYGRTTEPTTKTNYNNQQPQPQPQQQQQQQQREFRTDGQPRIRARRRHPVGKKDLVGSKDPEFPGKRVQWSMEKETCAFQNTASQWLRMFLEIVFKQNKPICLLLFGLCAPF